MNIHNIICNYFITNRYHSQEEKRFHSTNFTIRWLYQYEPFSLPNNSANEQSQ